MRWPHRRERKAGANRPANLLAWALAIGFLFGLIGAGEYPEDRLRVVRNHLNERPVSGDIVIVGVDEKNTGNLTMGAGFSSVDAIVVLPVPGLPSSR